MARVGVSITKSCSFRNAVQEFTNVYYYDVSSLPSASEAASLIDAVKALEVGFHSTLVTFKFGRCWSETGNKLTNEMIEQHVLSGTGSNGTVTAMDPERAYLFRQRAGVDSRGQPVYLRKWYHSVGNGPGNQVPLTATLAQTSAISGSVKTAMETAVQAIQTVVNSGKTYTLVAKSGRQPSVGAAMTSHSWLEHHQLGDMWRAS